MSEVVIGEYRRGVLHGWCDVHTGTPAPAETSGGLVYQAGYLTGWTAALDGVVPSCPMA